MEEDDCDAVPISQIRREQVAGNPAGIAQHQQQQQQQQSPPGQQPYIQPIDPRTPIPHPQDMQHHQQHPQQQQQQPQHMQYNNAMFEPAQTGVNRPWQDAHQPQEAAYDDFADHLSTWETYKFSVLVALIALGAAAIVVRWPSMFFGKDKWLAVAVLCVVAGWFFHTIAPLI